tara:strand:- start:127 stop:729 length:603 start_codon:yes stop_codon:yes gene_type:complete
MEQQNYKYDLHVHTNHSFDGQMSVEQAIEAAKEEELAGIAITEHDNVESMKEVSRLCKEHGLLHIPGIEITTPGGDIIALNIRDEIVFNGSYEKVIEKIHKQGGIAILAHPFAVPFPDALHDNFKIIEMIDAVEVFNGETPLEANMMAMEFAKENNKPGVAGSDSHTVEEVGNAYTVAKVNTLPELMDAIKKGEVVIGLV